MLCVSAAASTTIYSAVDKSNHTSLASFVCTGWISRRCDWQFDCVIFFKGALWSFLVNKVKFTSCVTLGLSFFTEHLQSQYRCLLLARSHLLLHFITAFVCTLLSPTVSQRNSIETGGRNVYHIVCMLACMDVHPHVYI